MRLLLDARGKPILAPGEIAVRDAAERMAQHLAEAMFYDSPEDRVSRLRQSMGIEGGGSSFDGLATRIGIPKEGA